MKHYKYPTLFSPINVNGMQMQSHVIQSGMVVNFSTEDGLITDRDICYMVERAKSYVGVQLVGAAYTELQAKGHHYQVAIDRDECIEGLSKLTKAVHEVGGKIGIQILHAGFQSLTAYNGGQEILNSSDFESDFGKARAMTKDEIKKTIKAFGEAAVRVKKAGFDMMEVHAAHMYLIDSFYSKALNTRTDEYGGSLENRMRFGIEALKEIRNSVGPDFPISVRITSDELLGENGNTVKEACIFANRLVDEAGVDIINVSTAPPPACPNPEFPEGVLIDTAAEIKKSLGDKCLVAVVGRIKSPVLAEYVLRTKKADLITIGRALICDSEFLTKIAEDREDDIRRCTSCSYCIGTMVDGNRAACIQNPMFGHECEYDFSKPAPVKKKVVVAGGGAAGMQAAIVCKKRGHDVVLLEASNEMGGLINVAKMPPFKYELENVTKNLCREMKALDICVKLNTPATKESVLAENPDAVIVATGSVPAIPPIPGIDQDNVYNARDILLGNQKAEGKTVVIGGGTVGMETADYLLEQGNEVTVIEMLPDLLGDLESWNKGQMMARMTPRLAECLVETKVSEIAGDKVITDKKTIDGVQSVVLATGSKPVNTLANDLADSNIKVCCIGDSVKIANIFFATKTAIEAAYNI